MFQDDQHTGGHLSARQYLSVLATRRWLILIAALATLAVIGAYTITRPEIYRATARIMIEPGRSDAMSFKEAGAEAVGADRDYYETQYHLLRDRELAASVFEKLEGSKIPEYAQAADPVAAFMGGIYVAPIKKSRLVDVGYEHTDPVWAALVSNTLVETYIKATQQRDSGASERALIDLTGQARELEVKLRSSYTALQEFREENDLVVVDDPDGPSSIALDRLARLEEAVTQAQIRRMTLEAKHETAKRLVAEGGDEGKLAALFQGETLWALRLQLSGARQDRAKLAEGLAPNHPEIQAVGRQITEIKASIAAESERILTAMQAGYEQAKAEEESLNKAYVVQKEEVHKLGRLSTRYAILKMEAERTGRLYEAVIERIKEIDLIAGIARGGSNVFFIHKARVPQYAIRPNKLSNLILALLLGPVLGIGLALVSYRLDSSLKSKEDIEQALELPILGFVPAVKGKRRGDANYSYLLGLQDANSPVAETFRTICNSLMHGNGGTLARRIVITSATANEGKTLVAINLAAALARSGERVLVIDSDMRRPTFSRIFDIRIWATLKNYLQCDDNSVAFNEVVYSTCVENLDVLPCGRPSKSPADLLNSGRMKQLVRDALSRYDRIIFDSPPCLGIADAGVLAVDADATLLVVRAFETPRHLTQRAKEVMHQIAGNIIGVVVNDVDAERRGGYCGRGGHYGRADYYGGRSYYGSEEDGAATAAHQSG